MSRETEPEPKPSAPLANLKQPRKGTSGRAGTGVGASGGGYGLTRMRFQNAGPARLILSVLLVAMTALLLACGAEPSTEHAPATAVRIDSAGRSVAVPVNPQRIVSLAPSASELIFALGGQDLVIAVDDYSPLPPSRPDLPRVGAFTLDYELITALSPDLVIGANITPLEQIDRIADLGIPVWIVDSTTIAGIAPALAKLAAAIGRTEAVAPLTADLARRLEQVSAAVDAQSERPGVYWELDATDPTRPFAAGPGSLADEIITLAGGRNVLADIGEPYPQVSLEAIVARDPAVIVLANAPWGVDRQSLAQRPAWAGLSALTDDRVIELSPQLADAGARATPAVFDLIEYLQPRFASD
ncbi:MAG: ABC transporter substrate-binding protein [Chloroflexi bacterium]|nr:ABC transporter substrate-binding protein [Chloroflexota bacterium]